MNWYVLQVMTGTEDAVRQTLTERGYTARAPVELVQIRKCGQMSDHIRILFPSYVFVFLRYEDCHYHHIKNMPNVIKWLGMENGTPTPLNAAEQRWITMLDGTADRPLQPSAVSFCGDKPEILSGILLDLQDEIVTISRRQRRAIVRLPILGNNKTIRLSVAERMQE